jgi:hypothetical protein
MTSPETSGVAPRSAWLSLAALALVVAVSVVVSRPPSARPASGDPAQFSAERAMAIVRELAHGPRLPGSPAHARGVEALIDHLRALDLPVELLQGERNGWPLTDLVVQVPGPRRGGGELLLMAHHDSVASGPGAGDDLAGVAALLEVLRALLTDPEGPGPVTLLLTDGEELGLLGARMFLEDHPRAGDVAAVLNVEGRGCGGPSTLFELGPGSGPLLRLFADVAPHPFGSSVAPAVYARMPNDTDLSPFRDAGLPGLNMAFFAGGDVYHTARDVVDALDPGSVQHHGANLLAVARAWRQGAAQAVLAEEGAGPTPVFTFIPGLGLAVVEARWAGVLVLVLALGAVLAVLRRGVRQPGPLLAGLARTALALVLAVAVPAGVVWGLSRLGLAPPDRPAGNVTSTVLASCGAWALQIGVALVLARRLSAAAAPSTADGALLATAGLAMAGALLLPEAVHVPGLALAAAVVGRLCLPGGRALPALLATVLAGLILGPQVLLLGHVGSVAPAVVGLLAAVAALPVALAAGPSLLLARGGRGARRGLAAAAPGPLACGLGLALCGASLAF